MRAQSKSSLWELEPLEDVLAAITEETGALCTAQIAGRGHFIAHLVAGSESDLLANFCIVIAAWCCSAAL